MNESTESSILNFLTGGDAIQVNVQIDTKSLAYLAAALVIGIFAGQILSALVVGRS